MELPGRCGRWLDTDTVTVQGFKLRLDTTSKGWGLVGRDTECNWWGWGRSVARVKRCTELNPGMGIEPVRTLASSTTPTVDRLDDDRPG